MNWTRRRFLGGSTIVAAGLGTRAWGAEFPPVRMITKGPRCHWFGYYDKLQFSHDNRYVLSNEVGFEHRTPKADDAIKVGMVDIGDGDQWIELGESRAWGWQQGCMLQWRPGSKDEVMWNDREGDRHVCHVLNVKTREKRTLPRPIYTVSPDGEFALSADFARIQVMRPGYGYVGLPDPHGDELAPKGSGVFRVDLKSGESKLILSLEEVAELPHQGKKLEKVWHYFNHLLVGLDSRRFVVLHRWRKRDGKTGAPSGGFTTRMISANVDGSDLYVLDPSGHTSHFIWRDPEHLCMWTKPVGREWGFYLLKDKTPEIETVGAESMKKNGHNTYLPGTNNEWILNDTYPDAKRMQKPYLYHVPSKRTVMLGEFHLPKVYSGEWRCDTHPRSSNDGKLVCIDAPDPESGRQLHLIDVGGVVG